jgi:predicted nucleic acid-binding protein
MPVMYAPQFILHGLAASSGVLSKAHRDGAIIVLASVAMMLEFESVLRRADNPAVMDASAAEIGAFLDALALLAEPVSPGFFHRPSIRVPDDEIFAEAAINSHADALVTFNRGDYRPADDRTMPLGIDICRPGDLLRRLTWRPSMTTRSAFRLL